MCGDQWNESAAVKDAEHFTGFKLYDVCKITTARWPQSQTGLNAAFFTQKQSITKPKSSFIDKQNKKKQTGKNLKTHTRCKCLSL